MCFSFARLRAPATNFTDLTSKPLVSSGFFAFAASDRMPVRRELEEADAEKAQQKSRQIALADEFAKATREKDTGRGDSASSAASDAPHPAAEPEIARRKRRDTERLRAFNEAARGSEDKRDAPSPAPHPEAQPATERKKLRDTERLRRFNEAARGDEGDSRDESAADAPAPAGEAKIRRRKRDHDRESMRASGRDDRRREDGYDGTPRRNRGGGTGTRHAMTVPRAGRAGGILIGACSYFSLR